MDSGTLVLIVTIVAASIGGTWKLSNALGQINATLARFAAQIKDSQEKNAQHEREISELRWQIENLKKQRS